MGLAGRYFSVRDLKVINSWNAELMGDVIQTTVTIYKVAASATNTNVYGESDPSTGITFYPGVEITSLIERENLNTEYDNFGPDRSQNVIFRFRENMLKLIQLYPEVGDVVEFNTRYYELDNIVNNEQLLGGVDSKSHSIICHSHYSRLSKLNLVVRNF